MRSIGHTCFVEFCDAPATSHSGRLMCGGHWHRVPYQLRREILEAIRLEDWSMLRQLQELAVTQVEALELVAA